MATTYSCRKPTTIGPGGLNGPVRNGKVCCPSGIVTMDAPLEQTYSEALGDTYFERSEKQGSHKTISELTIENSRAKRGRTYSEALGDTYI